MGVKWRGSHKKFAGTHTYRLCKHTQREEEEELLISLTASKSDLECVFYLKVRQSVFYSSFQCLYWALGWSEGDLDLIDVRVDFGERGVLEGGWSEVKDFLRRGSGSLTQASLPQLQISLFQGVFLA